jgi:hypothetical protein
MVSSLVGEIGCGRWALGRRLTGWRWAGWNSEGEAEPEVVTAMGRSSSARSLLMAMAAAEPSAAAVITWARGLTAFPAAQTPEMLVRPVASTATQPLSWVAQPRSSSVRGGAAQLVVPLPGCAGLRNPTWMRGLQPGPAVGPGLVPLAALPRHALPPLQSLPPDAQEGLLGGQQGGKHFVTTTSGGPQCKRCAVVDDLASWGEELRR